MPTSALGQKAPGIIPWTVFGAAGGWAAGPGSAGATGAAGTTGGAAGAGAAGAGTTATGVADGGAAAAVVGASGEGDDEENAELTLSLGDAVTVATADSLGKWRTSDAGAPHAASAKPTIAPMKAR
jgi:hypothetical protein